MICQAGKYFFQVEIILQLHCPRGPGRALETPPERRALAQPASRGQPAKPTPPAGQPA